MAISAQVFIGKVMHRRLFPKVNAFTYRIYYLCLPLQNLLEHDDGWRLGINRPALVSWHAKDHAERKSEADLQRWAEQILQPAGIDTANIRISLMTMPHVLGYVFNPVNFWFCEDDSGALRAVICEVNNTFGETHSYLCAHPDGSPIVGKDRLFAQKTFHVSPFLQRQGSYCFRFDRQPDKTSIWIDYYAADGQKQLVTALIGKNYPLTRSSLRRAFWGCPLVTVRAIWLIHWQALKLLIKGAKYIPKPLQEKKKVSSTDNSAKD